MSSNDRTSPSGSIARRVAALEAAFKARAGKFQAVDWAAVAEGYSLTVNVTVDFDAMLVRRLNNEPPMQRAKGEFGGRVGIWRLLELFSAYDIPATVFTPGRICELYPQALKALAAAGHEIADHMWEHRIPEQPAVERAHLERATDALTRISGKRPCGTRSGHTPTLLREQGYIYNSIFAASQKPFTIRDDASDERFLQLPFHYALDDAQFYNFGWLSSGPEAQRIMDVERVTEMWWAAAQERHAAGGYFNLCLHPFISGRAARIQALATLFDRIRDLPNVRFLTCRDVAALCLRNLD